MILILNIDFYLVVNGFFFNEDYVSEVYHLEKPDSFFTFVPRSINRFLYTSMVGVVVGFIIRFLEIDENRIKRVFKREKDNILDLKYEIVKIMKDFQKRYKIFITVVFIITGVSWYYVTCFNNVYPHLAVEWIKTSIAIIIIEEIISFIIPFCEVGLRMTSFRFKSEKIYKFSKLLI